MAITRLTSMLARQRSISTSTIVASNMVLKVLSWLGRRRCWVRWRKMKNNFPIWSSREGKCRHSTFSLLWWLPGAKLSQLVLLFAASSFLKSQIEQAQMDNFWAKKVVFFFFAKWVRIWCIFYSGGLPCLCLVLLILPTPIPPLFWDVLSCPDVWMQVDLFFSFHFFLAPFIAIVRGTWVEPSGIFADSNLHLRRRTTETWQGAPPKDDKQRKQGISYHETTFPAFRWISLLTSLYMLNLGFQEMTEPCEHCQQALLKLP